MRLNTYTLNKLVRKNDIARMQADDVQVQVAEPLEREEYLQKLHAKLGEEVAEMKAATNPKKRVEELADIIEVVREICRESNYTLAEMEQMRSAKFRERGGFSRKNYVTLAHCPPGSRFDDMFALEPHKTPLVKK
ncbi:MAG TPA: nucleoside triphosphate pyrophosphohydrolase [Alphaproteobacteria bacterium]|nr:nucleoside triphosphate pyrophosphohydrolase [Alphaproteobacteria bacterium]